MSCLISWSNEPQYYITTYSISRYFSGTISVTTGLTDITKHYIKGELVGINYSTSFNVVPEPSPKILPNLHILERQYNIARAKHNRKEMARLERLLF
jgi:hypothetical protein